MEADIARFYPGRSVAQFWRGEMSLRELRVLITNLPPESATVRRLRGHNWSDDTYLLASLLDNVVFHRAEWATSRGAKPPKPKPAARPQVPEWLERAEAEAEQAGDDRRPTSARELARGAHEHVLDQIRGGG